METDTNANLYVKEDDLHLDLKGHILLINRMMFIKTEHERSYMHSWTKLFNQLPRNYNYNMLKGMTVILYSTTFADIDCRINISELNKFILIVSKFLKRANTSLNYNATNKIT